MAGVVRIEPLNAENYDTWKMQMRAILIKNDLWSYVDESAKCPTETAEAEKWSKQDQKAAADIMLAMSPTELGLIAECHTARQMWLRLESTYQSKGPARKATLLKRVALSRMRESENVRAHLNDFFDAVAKLKEIGVPIGDELLAILLLYSLPDSYETFRCAVETRDELPKPEILRVKIIEESESRKSKEDNKDQCNALYAKKEQQQKSRQQRMKQNSGGCFKCGRNGHYARNCKAKNKNSQTVQNAEENSNKKSNVCFTTTETVFLCPDGNTRWCLDSGCTSHMSANKNYFKAMCTVDQTLNLANNNSTKINGIGNVEITVHGRGNDTDVQLKDVLYVSDLRTNLLSVSKITDSGYEVKFGKTGAIVTDKNNKVCLRAERIGNLYYMQNYENTANFIEPRNELDMWHYKMGHLNERDLKDMAKSKNIYGLNFKPDLKLSTCEVCISQKQTRSVFPKKSGDRCSELLEIVHSDVCGPMRCQSNSGAKYFVTFIDEKSRYCEVFFLKKKSDVFSAFVKYKASAENFTGKKIKALQSDNGREYCNNEFDSYLVKNGIKRRLTTPHTPQQNGMAERKNRTLVEMSRCMMSHAGSPPSFWAEAINTACYIRNRCVTKTNGEIPYNLWTNKKPTVMHFKVFGCKGYVLNKNPSKGKFESRSELCTFVGYSSESKAYRMWCQRKRDVIISRDVKFINESGFNDTYTDFFDVDGEKRIEIECPNQIVEPENNVVNNEMESESEAEEEVVECVDNEKDDRRGRGRPRLRKLGLRGRPKKLFQPASTSKSDTEDEDGNPSTSQSGEESFEECELAYLSIVADPITLSETREAQNSSDWRAAIEDEYLAQIKNNTWEIVERPNQRQVIDSRLVFRTKDDGTTAGKKKVRLVAKGYSQRPGEDFHETYSPVARYSSIRMLTALAAEFDMEIHQMDVVTAYLNGKLEENVYMKIPEQLMPILTKLKSGKSIGTNQIIKHDRNVEETADRWLQAMKNAKDPVCLLKKALYGLRQSGLMWYYRLTKKLKQLGLNPTKQDPCLFSRQEGERIIILSIYVDDLLLASNVPEWIRDIKLSLSQSFDMKDIGPVKRCLGIDFQQKLKSKQVFLSQRNYAELILDRFGMAECKSAWTPMEANCKLSIPAMKDEGIMSKFPYQRLIGALMYLAVTTRPDIAYAVNFMSQFNSNYNQEHWKSAKRILRYIRGTLDYGLLFTKTNTELYGVVDADWGGNMTDRRSYSGYAFILGGSAISWEARKQKTVSLSSTEAEYIAVAEATKEALYLKNILNDIGIYNENVTLFNDSQSAQKLIRNCGYSARTKHIDIRHHFVRDCLRNNDITLEYISTDNMPADMLTKGLNKNKHQYCSVNLGLTSHHLLTSSASTSRGGVTTAKQIH